ncbi:MAG: hypothetical protein ACJ8ER_06440 [Allosphingosinicella sp.]
MNGAMRYCGRTALGAFALLLSGCSTSPAFRETVGQFGTVAKAAIAEQNSRLAAITAETEETIRQDLAARRVQLQLDPNCALTLAPPLEGQAEGTCTLTGKGGAPVETAPTFANVQALSAGLSGYADSLAALAADSSADQQAFAQSLSGLAGSLGTLDGAIQKATNATPADRSAKYGAVATLLGEAGNLYFDHRRNSALKRIILAADPLVQEATGLLSGVGAGTDLYDRSALFRQLSAAQDAAEAAAADPGKSVEEVRTAQDALFNALDLYNAHASDQQRFAAVGAAHAKLAEAGRRGASAAQLAGAIEALVSLAGTAGTTVKTLESGKGSASGGNQNQ